MPAQQSSGGFFKAFGKDLKTAHDKHKNDETDYGSGGNLPGGVRGTARLTDMKFSQFKTGENKGKYFFYAAGAVLEPVEYKGCRTSIMEKMFPTPAKQGQKVSDYTRQTLEDHYQWMLNELRKLGVITSEISVDDIEGVFALLVKQKPTFRFSTREGQKQTSGPNKDKPPMVFESWHGLTESTETDPNAEVTDTSGDNEEPTEEPETEAAGEGEGGDDETAETAADEGDDFDALGKAADSADTDAQERLAELATEVGIDSNDKKFKTWKQVAAAVAKAQAEAAEDTTGEGDEETTETTEEGEETTEADEEEFLPEVGQIYGYKPVGKDKKVGKKVQVKILEVDADKKKVKLKNMADKKTVYSNVPFDKLEDAE